MMIINNNVDDTHLKIKNIEIPLSINITSYEIRYK